MNQVDQTWLEVLKMAGDVLLTDEQMVMVEELDDEQARARLTELFNAKMRVHEEEEADADQMR